MNGFSNMKNVIHDNNELIKYETTEEVLDKLGWKNYKLIYIVFSMALIWTLTAFPTMSPAFIVDGIKCFIPNDTKCLNERNRYYSINKEFGFSSGQWYSGELFVTCFFLGNMLMGTVLSYLADHIGRRKIVIGSLFGIGSVGFLCSFCNSFQLLLVLRFFQGGFFTPVNVINWVHASECISIKYHGIASMIFGFLWITGYCAVAGIAYFLPHWQHFMLATSLPIVLLSVIFWFTVPESFQYLIEKNERAKAKKWINNVENSKTNLFCDVNYLIANVQRERNTTNKKLDIFESFKFLWINQKYIWYLAGSIFLWITDMLLYNAMSLMSTSLSGDAYLNYLFSGIIEIPAYMFIPILINRIGCKKFVITVHLFTAASLFPILFIPIDFCLTNTTFWLLGKLGAAIGVVSLFVYGAEIFPPNVRSTCLGTAAFFGNIGGMVSFQTQYLKEINPLFPVAFYSCISFIAGVITVFLPETDHNRKK